MREYLMKNKVFLTVIIAVCLFSFYRYAQIELFKTSTKPKKYVEIVPENQHLVKPIIFKGTATYYHKKFEGRKTASGEEFDNNKYTFYLK